MRISLGSVVSGLGYAAIFLLPNHDLFNYVFQGTPLVVWKQALALLLIVASASWLYLVRHNRVGLGEIRTLLRLLLFLSALLILYSLALGISATRIIYGAIGYVGYSAFTVFACIVIVRGHAEKLLRVLFLVILVGAIGIVADYFLPILDFLPRSEGNEYETQLAAGYLRRAAFLFGASTTVFPALSFGVVAAAILYIQKRSVARLLAFALLFAVSLVAIYLTGSRANLLLYLSFATVVYLGVIGQSRVGKALALVGIPVLLAPLLMRSAEEYLVQFYNLSGRYLDPFSSQAEGNDHRFYVWGQALSLFESFGIESVLGHGLGTTVNTIDDGFAYSTHYESSFFQAFYEGGAAGVLLRYGPAAFAVYSLMSRRAIRMTADGRLLLAWLIWYCVAISVAPTAGAYHTQMVYFITCGMALYGNRQSPILLIDHRVGRLSYYA